MASVKPPPLKANSEGQVNLNDILDVGLRDYSAYLGMGALATLYAETFVRKVIRDKNLCSHGYMGLETLTNVVSEALNPENANDVPLYVRTILGGYFGIGVIVPDAHVITQVQGTAHVDADIAEFTGPSHSYDCHTTN